MQAHLSWTPRVPRQQQMAGIQQSDGGMPEAPLHHVLPVLLEVDIRAALRDSGLLLMRVQDELLARGPVDSSIRRTPQGQGSWTVAIHHEGDQPPIRQVTRCRDLPSNGRLVDRVAFDSCGPIGLDAHAAVPQMDIEIPFFDQVVRPEERGEFTGMVTWAQPLIPIVDFVLRVLSHLKRRKERLTPIPRNCEPRRVATGTQIIELLEAFEGDANRPVIPVEERSRERTALQLPCGEFAPRAPRLAFVV